MLTAYVSVPKTLALVDGECSFAKLGTIYSDLGKAISMCDHEKEVVAAFTFTYPEDLINAAGAAVHGDVWQIFRVKWLEIYKKTSLTQRISNV